MNRKPVWPEVWGFYRTLLKATIIAEVSSRTMHEVVGKTEVVSCISTIRHVKLALPLIGTDVPDEHFSNIERIAK